MSKKIVIFYLATLILYILYYIYSSITGNYNFMVSNEWFIRLFLIIHFLLYIIASYLHNKKLYKLIKNNKKDLLLKKMKGLFDYQPIGGQIIYLNVAVICLNDKDITNFDLYINKIYNNKLRACKHFWETIKYILEKDFNKAKEKYYLFLETPKKNRYTRPYESYGNLLFGLLEYYEGDKDLAKEKVSSYYDQITSPIVKQLCDEIIYE